MESATKRAPRRTFLTKSACGRLSGMSFGSRLNQAKLQHHVGAGDMTSRRAFLGNAANCAGFLALASLLRDDGLLADERTRADEAPTTNPLAPRLAHFAPKAKAC